MKKRSLINYILSPPRKYQLLTMIAIVSLMFLNTLLIIVTGGIPSAFAHTMYIPILITAIYFGTRLTFFVAVLSGSLVGPLMMVSVLDVSQEPLMNSVYRTIYFVLIGILMNLIFKYIRDQYENMRFLHTHEKMTGIPNYNYYLENANHKNTSNYVYMTLQINNYENLILMLGNEDYHNILKTLHKNICSLLSENTQVFLSDDRRFWIEIGMDEYQVIKEHFLNAFENSNIMYEEIPLFLDLSLGISLPSIENELAIDRFKESDISVMYAKTHSLRQAVYRNEFTENQEDLVKLGELPKALEEGQLFLMFQPIIDLKTLKCISLEALIRWNYKGEILTPNAFIPLAEKTHIINDVTEWVFKEAINHFETFYTIDPTIKLTVNISQRNLYNHKLINKMLSMVENAKFPEKAFEIEITESTLMLNSKEAQNFIHQFKKKGASTTLDDFGTGYSSLSLLRDLPVDKVKIDQFFTFNILKNKELEILVKSMIDLAHNLNLHIIAEGIENVETLEKLKALNCNYGQGYLFAKPMVLTETVKWLKKNYADNLK